MAVKKQIVVLTGGGHKGVVKIFDGAGNSVKVTCSLDFRPTGAYLYVVSNSVIKIPVADAHAEFETKADIGDDVGCVLRSSSITMFGGNIARSELLRRIEVEGKNSDGTTTKANKTNVTSAAASSTSVRDAAPLGEWTKYDGNNFYYAVKPQIDEMFVCYPSEKALETAVQNSKFIRVDAEDGYYVVGILYDDKEPAFICYGVPEHSGDAHKAPDELDDMCVWLPLLGDGINGYWIIYQSAKTGEIIK